MTEQTASTPSTNFTPTFEWIPITRLMFDPNNPRFRSDMDGHDTDKIFEFMIEDASLIDLMRSIASQGLFPGEPILVCPMPGSEGQMLVVEGNRRLAATKIINDPSLAKVRQTAINAVVDLGRGKDFTALPSLIFESRESILEYLGYRHVTGIKEWSPLAKARYLKQKYDALGDINNDEAFRVTARSIGSRSDYVGRLLTANELFERIADENFFGVKDLTESTIDFSLISSLLAYTKVVEFLGLDSSKDVAMESLEVDNLAFLTKFAFERQPNKATKLGESRNIGGLAEVLGNQKALLALRQGSTLSQAKQLLGTGADAFRTFLASALENLKLAQQNSDGVVLDERDIENLNEVRTVAKNLKASIAATGK